VRKLAPRAPRRHLIGLGLGQRPELRYPLLPHILQERWLRRRPFVEFCRDPTAKKEIRTAARRGWQSRQPKASGNTHAGKQGGAATTGHQGGAVSALARAAMPSAIASHGLVSNTFSNDGLV
jgi:hypothetical protein